MIRKKVNNLPLIIETNLKKIREKRRTLLLTTKSAQTASQFFLSQLNIIQRFLVGTTTKTYLEKIVRKLSSEIEVAYGVGGGRAIDGAKYISAKRDLELVAIPTILSTDAFLTDSTGIRKEGCVYYLSTKHPEFVYLDYHLLSQAPPRSNISGCGDVLSIFTALFDWKYANKKSVAKEDEKFNSSIYKTAQGILNGLLSKTKMLKENKKEGLKTLLNLLAMEVQLCNLYGNSRPEEGGEHFFTYCVENKMPHFLHGEMVAFGVLITAFIQGQNLEKIKGFMEELGLHYKPSGLTKEVVMVTLKELPDYVKHHRLRYSVYSDFDYQAYEKRAEWFLNKIGL